MNWSEAARGRASPGRPSRHVGGGGVDLHRPGRAAALGGLQAYLGEAIIVMLTLAFLRVDPSELWAPLDHGPG